MTSVKHPEAEVRYAALAAQEAITYNPQCASGNYITAGPYPKSQNSGLEVQEPSSTTNANTNKPNRFPPACFLFLLRA